jgi:hypothetical protein
MPRTAARQAALQQDMARAVEAGNLSQWQWPNNTIWLGGQWNGDDQRWHWEDGASITDDDYAAQRLTSIAASSIATGHDSDPWLCMVLEGIWHDSLPFHKFGIMCQIAASTTTPLLPTTTAVAVNANLRGLGAAPTVVNQHHVLGAMPGLGDNAVALQPQGSNRNKQIIGGVVGGTLGAAAVGLLGGLLGSRLSEHEQDVAASTSLRELLDTTATITTTLWNMTDNQTLWWGMNTSAGVFSDNTSQDSTTMVITLGGASESEASNSNFGTRVSDAYNATLRSLEGAVSHRRVRWGGLALLSIMCATCLVWGLISRCKRSKYGSSFGDQSPAHSESSPSRALNSRGQDESPAGSPTKEPMLGGAAAAVSQWLPLGSRSARTINMSPDRAQQQAQQSCASVQSFFEVVDRNHDGVISRAEFEEAHRRNLLGPLGSHRGPVPGSVQVPAMGLGLPPSTSLSPQCIHDVSGVDATRASIVQNLAATFQATVSNGASMQMPVGTHNSRSSHTMSVTPMGTTTTPVPTTAGASYVAPAAVPVPVSQPGSTLLPFGGDGGAMRGSPVTTARSRSAAVSLAGSPPTSSPRGGGGSPVRERSPIRVVRRSVSPIRRPASPLRGGDSRMASPRVASPIRVRSPLRGRPVNSAPPVGALPQQQQQQQQLR